MQNAQIWYCRAAVVISFSQNLCTKPNSMYVMQSCQSQISKYCAGSMYQGNQEFVVQCSLAQ